MLPLMILIFLIGLACGIRINQYVTKIENVTQVNMADNATQIGIVNNDLPQK